MRTILHVGIAVVVGLVVAGASAAQGIYDQNFVTEAGQSGISEIALGKLALARGEGAVSAFGQRMIDDHTKVATELKRVAFKAGAMFPSTPSADEKSTASELLKLDGADFDARFADTMIKDHQRAVALFTVEAQSGLNTELRAFAVNTLPSLQAHLRMAQELRNSIQ